MEHLDIFYRVFHEDLHPLTSQKRKEYYYTTIKKLVQGDNKEEIEILGTGLSLIKFQFYKLLLADTQIKIKRELHEKMFLSYLDKEQGKTMIRNHQSLLLNYCQIIENNYLSGEDDLSKFHISPDKNDIDIFKMIYQTLDNLLDYLEQLFYDHLDHTLPIPHQQKLWFIYKHKKLAEIIINKLTNVYIPEEIKNIIIEPLIKVKDNTLTTLSYQKQSYLTTYVKVLKKLLKKLLKKEPNPTFEMLYKILISLEYNTFNIFFLIKEYFKTQFEGLEVQQQLLQLYFLKRDIITIGVTSPQKFNPNLPSLKEHLLIWLKEEINLIKNSSKIAVTEGVQIPKKTKKTIQKKPLELSVSELSLIARLLFESELLTGSKKRMFQFLSETFTTHRSKAISVESLSNRYYSVSHSTKRSVGRMLRGMLYKLDDLQGEL